MKKDKKPSIRVVTIPSSSDKRELLVLNKIYGGNQ
tara:strand:- start:224 stop:328 length:105 start_codon:yes stop_codon:yes gene_type:complete